MGCHAFGTSVAEKVLAEAAEAEATELAKVLFEVELVMIETSEGPKVMLWKWNMRRLKKSLNRGKTESVFMWKAVDVMKG